MKNQTSLGVFFLRTWGPDPWASGQGGPAHGPRKHAPLLERNLLRRFSRGMGSRPMGSWDHAPRRGAHGPGSKGGVSSGHSAKKYFWNNIIVKIRHLATWPRGGGGEHGHSPLHPLPHVIVKILKNREGGWVARRIQRPLCHAIFLNICRPVI